uniref:Fatty acyl-CoA reductase n=1 Tax=Timema genevievae TaxID=629358 RepID=A0A7R9PR22_TIMGE|nr:unnamed protein product [Timema genevievae]
MFCPAGSTLREDTAMIDISEGSKIAEFYKGQTLFITGASGFMGKVLLEKILYACPGIVRIYILVRPKRGKSPKTRLEEMAKLPLFHRVHKERPHAFEKVVLVNGDVTMDDLGLSSEDRTLLEKEVTVVFHGAATLRLEAILKDAVEMNLNGTWRILQLCKKMSRLKVLVHLSTAFCHCDYEELEESMYPCSVNPHDVMRCCQWMDPAMLESITPSIEGLDQSICSRSVCVAGLRLLKHNVPDDVRMCYKTLNSLSGLISPHPNTYTFSKRLAEILVANEHPNLPVVIARPSIVTPAWREPLPGWVDNLNGPVGLMVAAGKGVVRSMHIKGEYHSEVIPVDFAINGLLMLATKVGSSSDRNLCKYHMCYLPVLPHVDLLPETFVSTTCAIFLYFLMLIFFQKPLNLCKYHMCYLPVLPHVDLLPETFVSTTCAIFLYFLMLIFFQKPLNLCKYHMCYLPVLPHVDLLPETFVSTTCAIFLYFLMLIFFQKPLNLCKYHMCYLPVLPHVDLLPETFVSTTCAIFLYFLMLIFFQKPLNLCKYHMCYLPVLPHVDLLPETFVSTTCAIFLYFLMLIFFQKPLNLCKYHMCYLPVLPHVDLLPETFVSTTCAIFLYFLMLIFFQKPLNLCKYHMCYLPVLPHVDLLPETFVSTTCAIFLYFLMLIFFQKPLNLCKYHMCYLPVLPPLLHELSVLSMVHIHKRIQNGMLLLQYFTTRRWVFHSSKFLALGEDGNQVDKDLFSIDFSQMVEEQYLKDCLLGGRQYCMKEPLSSLPRCRRILKVLYVVDKLWSIFFYGLLLWLVYSYSETARYVLDTATEYIRTAPVIRTLAKSNKSDLTICPKMEACGEKKPLGACLIEPCILDPCVPEPCVIIIGAGLAGLSAAHRLTKCGIRNFTVLEATESGRGSKLDGSGQSISCRDYVSLVLMFSSPARSPRRRDGETGLVLVDIKGVQSPVTRVLCDLLYQRLVLVDIKGVQSPVTCVLCGLLYQRIYHLTWHHVTTRWRCLSAWSTLDTRAVTRRGTTALRHHLLELSLYAWTTLDTGYNTRRGTTAPRHH